MKTFNEETKQKYIERAIAHRKAGEIIQGVYWKNGKGNCVGCLTHATRLSHRKLQSDTGIPQWLSNIADSLYDGLPEGECQTWPERFINAIPVNKDSEWFDTVVKPQFLIMILESTLDNFDHKNFPEVKSRVEDVIELWKRDDIGSEEWKADASRTAAKLSTNAVKAADYAANGTIFLDSAAYATKAAAKSAAVYGKTYECKAEKYTYFSKKLIEILNKRKCFTERLIEILNKLK